MRLRAYKTAEIRARFLTTANPRRACLLSKFQARLQHAVECDPEETQALEIPDDEWEAYTTALNDQRGG